MAGLSVLLGIIGNVISILMFASPIKTFKRVIKKKSTENYKAIPYITTLLSTSLWTFYGLIKPDMLVVTVNGSGAGLHIIYVALFLVYAPRNLKVQYLKLVGLLNLFFLGAVIVVTVAALHGSVRVTFVGIICAGLNIGMYAAPLSAMRTVIKTQSVEYMPFLLSFFQFLNGAVWSAYSVLVRDFFIGIPNGIGLILAAAQLIMYVIYRNKSGPQKSVDSADEEEEGSAHLVKRGIEMKGFEDGNEEMQKRSLNKGNSLPKPSLVREYSQKIMKTISWTPQMLASQLECDIENGDKEYNKM